MKVYDWYYSLSEGNRGFLALGFGLSVVTMTSLGNRIWQLIGFGLMLLFVTSAMIYRLKKGDSSTG